MVANATARRHALTFLENKEAVKKFEFKYWSGGGHIEVEINIKAFQAFLTEVNDWFEEQKATKQEAPEIKVIEEPPRNPFQGIKDLKWEDISVTFLDGHNVRIVAKETNVTANYKEMGFEDSRTLNPDSQWAFLRILANSDGAISWQDSVANDTAKKKKQLLSETLKDYFGISEDPFYPYKERKGYHIRVKLKPE